MTGSSKRLPWNSRIYRRSATRLRQLCTGLALAVLPGIAQAACTGHHQYPIAQAPEAGVRLLALAQADLERFFEMRLTDICVDEEELGAYYSLGDRNIVIGREFLYEIANPPGDLNHAVAVLAHEVAHAFQHKHNLFDVLVENDPDRVKCIELHADFLAGGFMGSRGQTFRVDAQELTNMFFAFGDEYVASDSHHGLSQERFVAFRQGFRSTGVDVITLSSLGIAYVSQTACD